MTLGIILLGKLPQKKIHMEETIKGIDFLKEGKENFWWEYYEKERNLYGSDGLRSTGWRERRVRRETMK